MKSGDKVIVHHPKYTGGAEVWVVYPDGSIALRIPGNVLVVSRGQVMQAEPTTETVAANG